MVHGCCGSTGNCAHPKHRRATFRPPRKREAISVITLEHVYILTGAMGVVFAVLSARDRTNPKRFGNAAFWGLLALSFLLGSELGDLANGLLVLALVAVGGFGLM